jgi:hypothetical protein
VLFCWNGVDGELVTSTEGGACGGAGGGATTTGRGGGGVVTVDIGMLVGPLYVGAPGPTVVAGGD